MGDLTEFRELLANCNPSELLKSAYDTGFRYERDYHGRAQALVDAGGHSHICPGVVGNAARMTVEVILKKEGISA